MRWKQTSGQAATETMMVISVVTIAVVAAGYSFVPMFGNGVNELSRDVAAILELGDIGGSGSGSGSGGSGGSGNGGGSGAPSTTTGGSDTRNGYSPSMFASAAPGNDTGTIPNQAGGNRNPLGQAPIGEFANAVNPGNDTDPIFNDRGNASWVNRGALGAAGELAGMSERGFGAPAGP